jgi:hypothetical protein
MNRQRYVVVFADTTRRETTIFAAILNNNRVTNRDEHCRTNKIDFKDSNRAAL